MRSRYHHDGNVDPHADSEHEILRRADEALERRRLDDHASRMAEHASLGKIANPLGGAASPLKGTKAAVAGLGTPTMPHEDFPLVPKLTPPGGTPDGWPVRQAPKTTPGTRAVRIRR